MRNKYMLEENLLFGGLDCAFANFRFFCSIPDFHDNFSSSPYGQELSGMVHRVRGDTLHRAAVLVAPENKSPSPDAPEGK